MHDMQNHLRQSLQKSLIFWIAAVPVLILDQCSKFWVRATLEIQPHGMLVLEEPYGMIVIPHLLAFIHTRNEGAAFSIFQNYPVVLTLVAAVLAVGVLAWALFFLHGEDRLSRIALGLIFGGALGNLFDRVMHDFQVVDFILVLIQWRGHLWPTFNVADSAICAGIGVFLLASFLAARQEKKNGKDDEKTRTKA